MSIGLRKILSQIKFDATNQQLVDRYLKLVAEMASEQEKVEHVLALANAVIESDPFLSLQLTQMVFSFDPQQIQALEIAVKALEDLGRFAKAEVLRNEMHRLEQEKLPPAPPAMIEKNEELARTLHIPHRQTQEELKSAHRFVTCIELLAHGWHREALHEWQMITQGSALSDDEWADAYALAVKIWEARGESFAIDTNDKAQLYTALATRRLVKWS